MGEPKVSVIVPCRNERRHIGPFLESVLSQCPIAGGIEIIIVDGMSNDGTREVIRSIVERVPNVRCIDNPGQIVSTGLNIAIREARGEFIARMDVHTCYASDYLLKCLQVFEATDADNVGGPWRARGHSLVQRSIAMAFNSPFAAGNARSHVLDYEGEVDSVYLGFWRRDYLLATGLFDEELVRNQDDELNLRIVRRGGKIWQSPSIVSWYEPRPRLGLLFKQYAQYGYWKVRVIQKHRLPASVRHIIPGSFVATLGGSVVLAPFFSSAGALATLLGLSYVSASLIASVLLCVRSRSWQSLLLLPPIFACFHFGYGCGFLAGVWRFWFGRRTDGAAFRDLTRS